MSGHEQLFWANNLVRRSLRDSAHGKIPKPQTLAGLVQFIAVVQAPRIYEKLTKETYAGDFLNGDDAQSVLKGLIADSRTVSMMGVPRIDPYTKDGAGPLLLLAINAITPKGINYSENKETKFYEPVCMKLEVGGVRYSMIMSYDPLMQGQVTPTVQAFASAYGKGIIKSSSTSHGHPTCRYFTTVHQCESFGQQVQQWQSAIEAGQEDFRIIDYGAKYTAIIKLWTKLIHSHRIEDDQVVFWLEGDQ